MSEIFGWFPQQNRDGLERLIARHHVETVIEIGSFLGLSASWLAARVQHVWCVDKWAEWETAPGRNNLVQTIRDLNLPNPFFDVFKANMIAAGVWEKITPVRCISAAAIGQVPEVDLVYVDGDHSYEGCMNDIALYTPKARKVICGDDHHNNPEGNPYYPGVVRAVAEAFPKHGADYTFWWKELAEA